MRPHVFSASDPQIAFARAHPQFVDVHVAMRPGDVIQGVSQ